MFFFFKFFKKLVGEYFSRLLERAKLVNLPTLELNSEEIKGIAPQGSKLMYRYLYGDGHKLGS